MNQRQAQILQAVIEEYVHSAEPVASARLVERYHLDVSPATIRNDFAVLEEEGYLRQPHSSAGRVPTEKGYLHYVRGIKDEASPSHKPTAKLAKAIDEYAHGQDHRELARKLAEFTQDLIIWADERHEHLFYTGFTALFAQPEFADRDFQGDFTALLDHIDEALEPLAAQVFAEPEVLIGSANVLSTQGATLIASVDNGAQLMIFGPMRMDYRQNLELMRFISYKLRHV